jgi:hypothetical protein
VLWQNINVHLSEATLYPLLSKLRERRRPFSFSHVLSFYFEISRNVKRGNSMVWE